MPDIELRFHKDMLVLSAPIDAVLARQGIDVVRDRQYLNLMEPDAIRDALNLEVMAGAQCLVTTTEDITRARLAHVRMEGDAARLADAAVRIAGELKPQHLLVEIGPCGLPLDASSKASLNENRIQYADAARAFDGLEFDAFLLNGFASIVDLKCALMGVSQVSGKPVFASVTLAGSQVGKHPAEASRDGRPPIAAAQGASKTPDESVLANLPVGSAFSGYSLVDVPKHPNPLRDAALPAEKWPEALAVMEDLGAAVVGFETADPLGCAVGYVTTAMAQTDLPVLAQLRVPEGTPPRSASGLVPLEARDDYAIDTMEQAATKLFAAGVQFIRATGAATPAYTGALAATLYGVDVLPRKA